MYIGLTSASADYQIFMRGFYRTAADLLGDVTRHWVYKIYLRENCRQRMGIPYGIRPETWYE
jgi:hypothetical protein